MRAAWWWIDRWRKSTAYTDLTLEEQGAYRNLLDELWLRNGLLPNDERILAKICGDALAWSRVRGAVLARFELTADGWRNSTHDEVAHQSERRAENQRRYRARRDNAADNAADNKATNKPDSPSPSPSPKEKKENPSAKEAEGQKKVRGDKPRTPRAPTRVPDGDLMLSDTDRTYAESKCIPNPDAVWEHFIAHHRAKGTLFRDWAAGWRTWVLNESRFRGSPGGNGRASPGLTAGEKSIAAARRMLADIAAEEKK